MKLSYLQKTDPSRLVRISGSTYCLKDHDSFRISHGKWFWFSHGSGGSSAVDFLTRVHGLSFIEAVTAVLGSRACCAAKRTEPAMSRLLLPQKSPTSDRVTEYLQRRCIDAEIIRYCLDRGLLYESRDGLNAVFVGYDRSGKARYAAIRSITSLNPPSTCSAMQLWRSRKVSTGRKNRCFLWLVSTPSRGRAWSQKRWNNFCRRTLKQRSSIFIWTMMRRDEVLRRES